MWVSGQLSYILRRSKNWTEDLSPVTGRRISFALVPTDAEAKLRHKKRAPGTIYIGRLKEAFA
jgi:hypothetical protein